MVSPEINLYDKWIFSKGTKTVQWRKSSLQQVVLGHLDSTWEGLKLDPYHSIHKTSLKMDHRPK